MKRERTITIGLMRHGQAGVKAHSDFDRPLTPRGVTDVKTAAAEAAKAGFAPSLIISSTSARARQTTELFQTVTGMGGDIVFDNDLYLCSPETIWRHIATAIRGGFDTLLLVGHNPGISQTAARLSNSSRECHMGTADVLFFEGEYHQDTPMVASLFREIDLAHP